MSEKTRAYLYRIALALIALAVVLNILPTDISDEVLNVITAVLGISATGLATLNTSRK